jgi:hypothetical protein
MNSNRGWSGNADPRRELRALRDLERWAGSPQMLQSVSIGRDSSLAHSLIEASYTLRFR